MKKLLLLLTILFLSAAWALAQTDQNNTSNPSSGTSATQSAPSSQTDTGNASTTQSTTTTTTDQNATPDQNANGNAAATDTSGKKHGKLPQTASPLPLLGLIGAGSLAAGVASRKKRKS